MTISDPKKFFALTGSWTPTSCSRGEHHTARLPRYWSLSHYPSKEKQVLMHLSLEITLATKCNSGSNKWPLAIKKNSVPWQGVKPQPLAIRVSIILLDYQDTDRCHITPQRRKQVLMHLSLEITLATKCNSGSNKWPLAIKKNSVPWQGVKPQPLAIRVSIILLDYQDTDCCHIHPSKEKASPHAFEHGDNISHQM